MGRVVIVIPARYGSTRLPAKALAEIGGEAMVVRVWRRCQGVRGAARILVATDDERIARAVRDAGGEARMTSPTHPSGTDRVAEAVRGESCDLVVNVQGDEPFIEPVVVEELIAAALQPPRPDAATLATPIRRREDLFDPSVVKVVVGLGGDAVYFSRYPVPFRQEIWAVRDERWEAAAGPVPQGYLRHLGLYAYEPGFLQRLTGLASTPAERAERLEQLRILEHGHRLRVVLTAQDSSSVDTPEDLARARARAVAEAD